jgi:hypothetical protein
LEEPEITARVMLEQQDLIDGFSYGEHWTFYEYPRYDRYGYLNNFYNLYLRDVKQTVTLQSILAFRTFADWDWRLDGKYRRYTMEKLAVAGGSLTNDDLFLETGEIILQAELPIIEDIWARADCRFQIYTLSSDDYLYFRHYYGNPYIELAYRPAPKVEFSLGWGINPIDRFDRYRRAKGRVDFLVEKINQLSDVLNYGRENEYKLELVRQAEEALEDEHRLTAIVEVNF